MVTSRHEEVASVRRRRRAHLTSAARRAGICGPGQPAISSMVSFDATDQSRAGSRDRGAHPIGRRDRPGYFQKRTRDVFSRNAATCLQLVSGPQMPLALENPPSARRRQAWRLRSASMPGDVALQKGVLPRRQERDALYRRRPRRPLRICISSARCAPQRRGRVTILAVRLRRRA